jgi:cell wall-associated NlpC family hydrolase
MINYAIMFVGIPYIWGGDNPVSGFDCSGFIQHVLDSSGMDPKGDQTAQSLYHYFKEKGRETRSIQRGALVFYGKSPTSITHISLAIDSHRIIEAGGGGRSTRSKEDAARCNACVRIKPLTHRSDIVGIIMPNYPSYMFNDTLISDGKKLPDIPII